MALVSVVVTDVSQLSGEAALSAARRRLARPGDSTGLHGGRGGSAEPNSITLGLSDLVPDRTGAIVIQTGGDRLVVELTGYGTVAARGIAPDDARSEHFDVGGLDFIRFEEGRTVYFSAEEVLLKLGASVAEQPRGAVRAGNLTRLIDKELKR